MISKEVLQEIATLDIVSVISEIVPLKRFGTVFKSNCPFHNEKTPSFTVNPSRGIYKCFGCGKGGDVVSFFMDYESFTFPQSVKFICDRYKIKYSQDDNEELDAVQKEVDTVLKINRAALDFFLTKMPESKSLSLATERGLSGDIITKFEIAHAPAGFSNLYKHLSVNFTIKEILNSGLCKEKEADMYHDMFRDRLMFPIHNVFGKIIGFSGRRNNEAVNPKYINSSETRVFKKSKELFGLFFAKKDIVINDEVIVVEGATDVISLHQGGITNTVGTLGTAFTADHATVIKRFSTNITLLYDGDNAGLKAVFKASEELIKQGLMIYICQLPESQDPDSYIRQVGGEAMQEYIKSNKRELIDFRLSLLSDNIADKIKLAKELTRMISLHPDKTARDILTAEYNKKFGFKPVAITKAKKPTEAIIELSAEFHLLRIILLYSNEWDVFKYFNEPSIEEMKEYGFVEEKYKQLFFYLYENQDKSLAEVLHEQSYFSDIANEIINTVFVIPDNGEYDVLISVYNYELFVVNNTEKQILDGDIDAKFKYKLNSIKWHKKDVEDKILNLVNSKK
jgi:DNA primase